MNEPDLPDSGSHDEQTAAVQPAAVPGATNATEALSAERGDEAIDLPRLNAALGINLTPAPAIASSDVGEPIPDSIKDHLEELADDMLHLLKRVESMENRLRENAEGLARVERCSADGYQHLGQQIEQLREEMAGERKGLAVLSILNGILPTLDVLQTACAGLAGQEETPVHRQMKAVIDILRRMLRGLGFNEFQAERGDPFDPHRMECVGYEEGKPGVVLDAVRPGYLTNGAVVRPAGVKLANPQRAEHKSKEEKSS